MTVLNSDQVTQGFVASGFGNLQGWIFHNLSGQPDPVLHYPHSKIFLT